MLMMVLIYRTHRAITLPWLAKDLNIPDNTDAEEPVLYTEIDSGVGKNNPLISPVKYFTLNVRGSTTARRLGSQGLSLILGRRSTWL